MARVVIIDVEGALVDRVDLHARAWQPTQATRGRDIPFDEIPFNDIRAHIGRGSGRLMPVIPRRRPGKAEKIEHDSGLLGISSIDRMQTTSDDAQHSKPHPATVQAAPDKLQLPARARPVQAACLNRSTCS